MGSRGGFTSLPGAIDTMRTRLEEGLSKFAHTMKRRFKHLSPTTWAAAAVVIGVAIVLVVVLAVRSTSSAPEDPQMPGPIEAAATGESDSTEAAEAAFQQADPVEVAAAARTALDAASATDKVNLFDAGTGVARNVDSAEVPEVAQALDAFEAAGNDVGFVVYDLVTKKGVGYNADAEFFSASTVKAPFVAYVVQAEVDAGLASLDDEIVEDMVSEGTGVMAFDDVDRYDLATVLSNTIVHSDNTGYALLRERFDQGGFETWCAAAGVDASAWEGEWYPYCTPRDLAKLWLNVGAYLMGGTGQSAWCADLFASTDRSFLREALPGEQRILAKPGYEMDTPLFDMGALNDAGLVLSDQGAYLVTIMSDADYDDEYFTDNEHLILDLAAALATVHDRLLAVDAG